MMTKTMVIGCLVRPGKGYDQGLENNVYFPASKSEFPYSLTKFPLSMAYFPYVFLYFFFQSKSQHFKEFAELSTSSQPCFKAFGILCFFFSLYFYFLPLPFFLANKGTHKPRQTTLGFPHSSNHVLTPVSIAAISDHLVHPLFLFSHCIDRIPVFLFLAASEKLPGIA